MSIKVKFFANLRDQYGLTEEVVDFNEGISISEIWDKVTNRQKMPESIMIAINMEYSSGDVQLKDNEEIAFFPPVSGG